MDFGDPTFLKINWQFCYNGWYTVVDEQYSHRLSCHDQTPGRNLQSGLPVLLLPVEGETLPWQPVSHV